MNEPQFQLSLSQDEALVLFEFLARFEQSGELSFAHPSEFLALQAVSGQLERELVQPFQSGFQAQLEAARQRLAHGFKGEYPGPKC